MRFIIFSILLFVLKVAISQELQQNEGLFSLNGELFSGTFIQTDETGQTVAILNIRNGRPHGKSEYFFSNGNTKEIRSYRRGKKHGAWLKYNENKVLVSYAKYSRDRKHGNWKIWDNNGVLRYSLNYKKGKKVGLWQMWDENKNLVSEKEY